MPGYAVRGGHRGQHPGRPGVRLPFRGVTRRRDTPEEAVAEAALQREQAVVRRAGRVGRAAGRSLVTDRFSCTAGADSPIRT